MFVYDRGVKGSHDSGQGRLERVRAWRIRDRQPVAIGEEVKSLQRRLERTGRRVCEFISVWEEAVPPRLAAITRVRGARGGVFHVSVATSPAMYEIDRLLREGALAAMRARLQGTLVRIKLTVEPLNDQESPRQ